MERYTRTVRQYLEDEIDGLGLTPQEINNGWCGNVAFSIAPCINGAIIHHSSMYGIKPGHTWIEVNGLHYDVECLDGTPNYMELPIFVRGQ